MDGYQGDDPKKYVELFRYDAEDVRGKHYKDMYVEHVCRQLTDMAEWRQQTKKKRLAEEDERDAKKVATED
ncbi:hypothetical protein TNCV_4388691 [Trichonephila clavipes]|nr:hypothetical protein TNCV_4388691 [Trichonephila clavipes]